MAAGGSYDSSWVTALPALGSMVCGNVFTLTVEDVTTAPYNLPPYPAAGDTASAVCTVTGIAP